MSEETESITRSYKANLKNLECRNEIYFTRIKELVEVLNDIRRHTFLLARYFFLIKLENDPNAPLEDYLSKDFFVEIVFSLIEKENYSRGTTTQTNQLRQEINEVANGYINNTGYVKKPLPNSQQHAGYIATEILTCYTNNIKNNFGNRLRQVINLLLEIRIKSDNMKNELKEKNLDAKAIKKQISDNITKPAGEIKLRLANFKSPSTVPSNEDFSKFKFIFESYDNDYAFEKGIYYDAKVHPKSHFRCFIKLAQYLEDKGKTPPQVMPLSIKFSPSFITIDTNILSKSIICEGSKSPIMTTKEDKYLIWNKVFKLLRPKHKKGRKRKKGKNKCYRPFHEQRGGTLRFSGLIKTDGVSVVIVKDNKTDRKYVPR